METTVPAAVAVNPNTFLPETTDELRADPTINPSSIPETPRPSLSSERMTDAGPITTGNSNTFRPETPTDLRADTNIKPGSIPDDPAPSCKRHRSATHSETPWDPFALVPAAASLPTALVQYHRERCGTDFDRFLSTLRTEALVNATLARERAQTALAEEQLRQLHQKGEEQSAQTTEGCPLVQRMTSLLVRSLDSGNLSLPLSLIHI